MLAGTLAFALLQTLGIDANLPVMIIDWFRRLETALVGRQCKIARRETDWVVNLTGGGSIALSIPWRIVADGGIAFANEDDGQMFGLPAPVDGEAKANSFILSRA